MGELLRLLSGSAPLKWISSMNGQGRRLAVMIALSYIAMTSGRISGDNAEQLTQLLIGILCTCGLLYFSYIELINPNIVVSDRLFVTLVSLIIASVGLREMQYRLGGQDPPTGPDRKGEK